MPGPEQNAMDPTSTKVKDVIDSETRDDLRTLYCRLCLQRAHEPCNQLNDTLCGLGTVREGIESLLGILTTTYTLAPTKVCRYCTNKLMFALAFRQKCLSSDEELTRTLEQLDALQAAFPISVDSRDELRETYTETLWALDPSSHGNDEEECTRKWGYDVFDIETLDDTSLVEIGEYTEEYGDNDVETESANLEYGLQVDTVEPTMEDFGVAEESDNDGELLSVKDAHEHADKELEDVKGKEVHILVETTGRMSKDQPYGSAKNGTLPSLDSSNSEVDEQNTNNLVVTDSIAGSSAASAKSIVADDQVKIKLLTNATDTKRQKRIVIVKFPKQWKEEGKFESALNRELVGNDSTVAGNSSKKASSTVSGNKLSDVMNSTKEASLQCTTRTRRNTNAKSPSAQTRANKGSAKRRRKKNVAVDMPELIPHTCYYCAESFGSAEALEEHLPKHTDLLPFTCDGCHTAAFPMVFTTLIGLNRHLESHRYPYPCSVCPRRFRLLRSVVSHVAQKHRDDQNSDGYSCERCDAQFELYHQMQRHQRVHANEDSGRFRCSYCQRAFGNGSCLRRHLRIHTGDKPYECRYCGKRFNHEHNFANHKRLHLNERVHACKECPKAYTNAAALRLHLGEHYPDDPRYGRRLRDGHGDTPGKPVEAKKRYSETFTSSTSSGWTVTAIPPGDKRQYECTAPNCHFTTTKYHQMFYHHQNHIKRFECNRCAKRFPMKQGLEKHIARVHEHRAATGKPNYLCSQCGKAFYSLQKLQQHIDVHEGTKHYRCRFCEKEFVQKVNCQVHERVHTREKPFSCRVCSKAFASSSGLRKHSTLRPCARGKSELPADGSQGAQTDVQEAVDQRQDVESMC